jgi:hypothetical protein
MIDATFAVVIARYLAPRKLNVERTPSTTRSLILCPQFAGLQMRGRNTLPLARTINKFLRLCFEVRRVSMWSPSIYASGVCPLATVFYYDEFPCTAFIATSEHACLLMEAAPLMRTLRPLNVLSRDPLVDASRHHAQKVTSRRGQSLMLAERLLNRIP